MKKLLLLSLVSLISAPAIGMDSPYAFTPKHRRQNPVQEGQLRDIYFFAQAESEIQSIVTKELCVPNPNKFNALEKVNKLIKSYYNDLCQKDKDALEDAFLEHWRREAYRLVVAPKQ